MLALIFSSLSSSLAKAVPPLPVIPASIFYVTNYGALGDGLTNNAVAISNAINAASLAGGGIVEITAAAGNYMCGPLSLKNNINLQVDAGATLQMLPITSWPGSTAFINGSGLHDVAISGSGTIDGNAHFGTGEWWGPVSGSPPTGRPNFINFDGRSIRILIQNVTLRNPPTFHLMLKGNNGNITIQGVNIDTDPTSPNTDGMDLGSTNVLVQNCHITDGDDNIEIGGSSATVADLLVTNCMFGHGHGVSVGSLVQAGVSNVTVINCTFTNTDYGIRMKSDNDRGGVVQNLSYYNITMTNILYAPILIYSYYNSHGSPSNDGITPTVAAGTNAAAVTGTMPTWQNIIISNLTATAAQPGMIWARTEWPATNITLSKLNITSTDSAAGNSAFTFYNVRGVKVMDPQLHVAGSKTFALFNAQVTFSNTAAGAGAITLDGFAITNPLAFYNQPAFMTSTDAFGANPITLSGSVLTNTGNFVFSGSTVINFILGTNASKFATVGNLTLGGTNNISAGAGFTNGIYTLLTYTGTLSGSVPALGTVPIGYNYAYDTGTAGQVKLVVSLPAPASPTNLIATGTNLLINLKWNSVNGATSYNLNRGTINTGPYPTIFSGLTTTNYIDANVTNAVNYFYVVTAAGAGGESTNSLQASATPLPSNQPTNIVAQAGAGQLQLSWPQSHLGWRLQIETNNLGKGIWTNWVTVPNSTNVISTNIVINPANGSVFLRLIYP